MQDLPRTARLRLGAACLALALAGCRAASANSTTEDERARALLAEARAALSSGEVERGLDLCLEALERAEDAGLRAELQRWTAHGFTRAGDPERALHHLDLGCALAPSDPWLRYARGVALQELGRDAEALAAFDRALELDPRHVKAQQWCAHVLQRTGRIEEALAAWTRALELARDADEDALAAWGARRADLVADCLRARAECHDALGQRERADADREAARNASHHSESSGSSARARE